MKMQSGQNTRARPKALARSGGASATRIADAASGGLGVVIVKILALGAVDAIAVFGIMSLLIAGNWPLAIVGAAATIIINWIYLRRGGLPAKYLTPGLVFLLIFQVFVIGYTGYVGFTNYGTGHNGDKDKAIQSLLSSAQTRVPDSPTFDITVLEQFGTLSLLVTDPDGDVFVGNTDNPLTAVENAQMSGGTAIGLDGYTALTFPQVLERQEEVFALSVQRTQESADGFVRTQDGRTGYLFESALIYDADSDTMTDVRSDTVYSDTGDGAFTSADGEQLLPGWRVDVGFDNFVRAFSTESIRGPLIGVILWTFAFALLSVASTFALGLFLAVVFNDQRMRGRKFYRILLILPYAFPAFLSALVWAGMLSESFGFVNQVLLGGASIPWLTDPWLAKVSLLLVNLWLGFPYMFLVTTGALQSIPEELTEAARVDGASAWSIMRLIKLPLLMVSVAPLLIASFAFNFNNFNLVYLLTGGGPREVGAGVNVGATDILISMVYKIAFTGQLRDYGLASAFSIIIFVLVATISIVSFRRTKALEDLN
jgi:arabinogalactan oligomer/maltooligosaccharide transport system permease protein